MTILKIKIYNILILVLSLILLNSGLDLFARGTGSRASFNRNAWIAGAKYAAMGSTGVVTSDDVYSIYWNPAGLTELKIKSRLTSEFINDKQRYCLWIENDELQQAQSIDAGEIRNEFPRIVKDFLAAAKPAVVAAKESSIVNDAVMVPTAIAFLRMSTLQSFCDAR